MDKKTASTLLEGMSEKELIKIIVKLANCSTKGERWLLDYCKKNGATAEKQIIIAEKQLLSHWEKAEDIIYECNCYGGGPREDEGYDELYKMPEIVKQYNISWEVRKKIVDGMMEQFRLGNSGFDDSLVEVAGDFCKTKEECMYLAGYLEKYGGSFYRNYAAGLYQQLGEEKEFERVQTDNLIYGSDYIRLAEYYKEKGDLKKAVLLVETALKKADGRMDEVYTWLFKYYAREGKKDKIVKLYETAKKKKWNLDTMFLLLYKYYKEKNDYVRQKEYLLLMMEHCDREEAGHWFKICRTELVPEDFENNKKKIYEFLKKHSLKAYCEVLFEDGNEEEILTYLNERTPFDEYWSFDYEHKFSRRLAKKFPQEIIKYYQEECECYCAKGKDKNYANAVRVLKDIKKVMMQNNLKEEWKVYFSDFKERHKRKRNLIKMLE